MRSTLIAVLLISMTALAMAQERQKWPIFAVASIKPNVSGEQNGMGAILPRGRYSGTNVPVQVLIAIAYKEAGQKVEGLPDWAKNNRYDVEARAGEAVSNDVIADMMKQMLAERFALEVHEEAREIPVYALVLGRQDGSLGPRMTLAAINCSDPAERKEAIQSASADGRPGCGFRLADNRILGGGMLLDTFVQFLERPSGRPVVDRTGLKNRYDISLEWGATDNLDAGSIFTALRDQLGLRLVSDTSKEHVIVVDRINRPTGN